MAEEAAPVLHQQPEEISGQPPAAAEEAEAAQPAVEAAEAAVFDEAEAAGAEGGKRAREEDGAGDEEPDAKKHAAGLEGQPNVSTLNLGFGLGTVGGPVFKVLIICLWSAAAVFALGVSPYAGGGSLGRGCCSRRCRCGSSCTSSRPGTRAATHRGWCSSSVGCCCCRKRCRGQPGRGGSCCCCSSFQHPRSGWLRRPPRPHPRRQPWAARRWVAYHHLLHAAATETAWSSNAHMHTQHT